MSSSWVAGANKKKKEVARTGKYKKNCTQDATIV
jgi:hypothetical protein